MSGGLTWRTDCLDERADLLLLKRTFKTNKMNNNNKKKKKNSQLSFPQPLLPVKSRSLNPLFEISVPLSCYPLFFKPKVGINKMGNLLSITTLALHDYPQGYIHSCLYRPLRALSVSRNFVEFSQAVLSTMVWKVFRIHRVQITSKWNFQSKN